MWRIFIPLIGFYLVIIGILSGKYIGVVVMAVLTAILYILAHHIEKEEMARNTMLQQCILECMEEHSGEYCIEKCYELMYDTGSQ